MSALWARLCFLGAVTVASGCAKSNGSVFTNPDVVADGGSGNDAQGSNGGNNPSGSDGGSGGAASSPGANGGNAGDAALGGSSGTAGGSDTAGSSGMAPSNAAGGTAGAADACGGCDDGDPCTEDACVEGTCEMTPIVGVGHDGFAESFTMQRVAGTTVVAGADRFYIAVQGQSSPNETDARIHYVETSGDFVRDGPSLRQIAGGLDIVAPVGMTATSAGEFQLAVFAPIDDADGIGGILPILFDDEIVEVGSAPATIAAAPDDRFVITSPRVGAHASTLTNGEPFAVWPSTVGITNYQQDTALDIPRIDPLDVDGEVLALTSVSLGALQGIAYATLGDNNAAQLWFVARDSVSGEPSQAVQFKQCGGAGEVVRIDAEAIPGTDTIAVTWSEIIQGASWATHAATVTCSGTDCTATVQCASADTSNGVLVELDGRYLTRSSEDGVAYRPQAVSISTDVASFVSVFVDRLDLATRVRERLGGDSGSIAAVSSVSESDAPPHFVQIDVLDEDVLFVSWVTRTAGMPDEVGMERFRICYPE